MSDTQAPSGLPPAGFDPSRNDPVAYTAGWNDAINLCGGIAEKWRDENKEARNKARVRGRKRFAFDGDETMLVSAEALDGAAIECNAIAGAIRMHAIATGSRRAKTPKAVECEASQSGGKAASPKGDGQ